MAAIHNKRAQAITTILTRNIPMRHAANHPHPDPESRQNRQNLLVAVYRPPQPRQNRQNPLAVFYANPNARQNRQKPLVASRSWLRPWLRPWPNVRQNRQNPLVARRRWAHGGARLLLVLLAALLALSSHIHTARADVIRYGADPARVQAAVRAAGWPERLPTWCGVAALAAVVNYRLAGTVVPQEGVALALDTPTFLSPWGAPVPDAALGRGPGFLADISRDIGTDPRALAAGQAGFTRQSYHQIAVRGSAYSATMALVADLTRSREPIHALVLRGGHSVLVSGVLATDDPVSDPASILDLEIWDPGYGQPNQNIQFAQKEIVPLKIWLTSPAYWGAPYAANRGGGVSADPDPSVGPYTYDPTHGQSAHLWAGHYVYIRPDAPNAPAAVVSADWALDASGAVIAGPQAELPTGYTGPAVTLASGARIVPASTPTTARPSTTRRESVGVPWWLALGALPLLIGGLLVYAAIRAQVRIRRAVALAAQPASAQLAARWADQSEHPGG